MVCRTQPKTRPATAELITPDQAAELLRELDGMQAEIIRRMRLLPDLSVDWLPDNTTPEEREAFRQRAAELIETMITELKRG